MMKLAAGGIVVVVVAAVGFALARAKQSEAPESPGMAVAAMASGSGSMAKESSRATDAAAGKLPVSASSQPAIANAPAARPSDESGEKNVMAALQEAADAEKHLLVFVYEKDDEQTRESRKTFDSAVARLGDAVQWIAIDRSAPSESEFVEQYGLKAAPMPLALSFAPNGAIIGGFVGARLTEQQLMDALASPGMQACLKALQDRKLVFLCAQNGTTKSNDMAMKGVNEFKDDERFAQATEIVKVDPSDAAEKKFLTQLQVNPKADEATTVFLAPPGRVIGKFSGATDKIKLVATLQAASSGCGAGGCGPKGCAPKK